MTFAGRIEVWHLLSAATFLGFVNAFDTPLRQAFLLEMVGSRENLPNAIALNSLMMNGSRLVGPALAGVVLAAAGEAWCFLLNAASYLAMLAALAAMQLPPSPATAKRPELAGRVAGGGAFRMEFQTEPLPDRSGGARQLCGHALRIADAGVRARRAGWRRQHTGAARRRIGCRRHGSACCISPVGAARRDWSD
ncbi:MAG: MFS transporter [Rhodocyclaceae bacterium]|nr:MFS transporter [Rhodocyclaceae bacterium]